MTTPATDAALDRLGVPDAARPQWSALMRALVECGPASCEQPSDIDAWWPRADSSMDDALQLCRVCPVRRQCADYALAAGEREGIWGGLTPAERAG